MFRAVMLTGPLATFGQFDTEKVSQAFKAAITNRAKQFAVAVPDRDRRTVWNWRFDLETNSRKRDVFQVGHSPLLPPGGIQPAKLNQLRTK